MMIQEDALQTLLAMASDAHFEGDTNRGRYTYDGGELSALTRLEPARVSDAVEFLEHDGLVKVLRAANSTPYSFFTAELTVAGRHRAEQHVSQAASNPPPAASKLSTKSPRVVQSAFETYLLEKKLGEGGSGTVYAAKREGDSTQVAVKLLDPAKATKDKRKRFKNELLFGSSNRHPGIVRILDHGLTGQGNDTPFYVMPMYPDTLRSLLVKRLQPERVMGLFLTALDGLEAAHLLSVVHRDVKPENIFYDAAEDRLVLGDFGIAHFGEDELHTQVETGPNARLANFQYAAPEQRSRGATVDQRADIYAMGLILNEMFTGVMPHGTGYATIAAMLPSAGFLDGIVEWMLRQDPKERPATIRAIKNRLITEEVQFVKQQRIDALTQTIVPTTTITTPSRIEIAGVDIQGDDLVVSLSEKPSPDWLDNYRTAGRATFILGHEPWKFELGGGVLRRQAREHEYQQIITTLKEALKNANDSFPKYLTARAEARERAERDRLEAMAAAERRRLAALKKLSF